MPFKLKKPCSKNGCPELTHDKYCDVHRLQENRRYHRTSRPFHGMYQTKAWQVLRVNQLRQSPWCVKCLAQGRWVLARVVDHIQPHRGNNELFLNPDNLQSLCKSCHDRKTVREDKCFGERNTVYRYPFEIIF